MKKSKKIASADGCHFKTVVIGSGFGGAIVACRIAQAEKGENNVAILERGMDYSGPGPYKGHFEVTKFEKFRVARANAVGGGSMVYYNVRLRPEPEIFADQKWPEEITRDLLDRYFDLSEGMLACSRFQPNPGDAMPKRVDAFLNAARQCGGCGEDLVPLAVHSGGSTVPSQAGIPQYSCVRCGQCIVGCPHSDPPNDDVNARSILPLNYLAVAQAHGARIFPEHPVSHITKQGEVFRVYFDSPHNTSTEFVTAGRVVLGAGSLGSTEILLRSKDLNFNSKFLGHCYSGNGDFLGRTEGTEDLDPADGPTITAGATFKGPMGNFTIQDIGNVTAVEESHGWPITTVVEHLMGYLAMGHDAANGQMVLDENGKLDIIWDPRQSLRLYNSMIEILKDLSTKLGGTYEHPREYDETTGNGLLTAHPLGGCPMGDEPDGLVNHAGQVRGVGESYVEGLYVADAAIIPTAVVVNPSFTISALAERVAFLMLNDGVEMDEHLSNAPENPIPPGPKKKH